MIAFSIPLKTVSGGNSREHPMVRHKRVKAERAKVNRVASKHKRPGPFLTVLLVRVAPRELDPGDNLPSALKGARDAVASWLRIDDRSTLVSWHYAQEKGKTGEERVDVRIDIAPRRFVVAEPLTPQAINALRPGDVWAAAPVCDYVDPLLDGYVCRLEPGHIGQHHVRKVTT